MPDETPAEPLRAQGIRRKVPRLIALITFCAGIAGLVWMLSTLDPAELRSGLRAIGPWFALTCAAHLTALCLDSVTLRACVGMPGLGLGLFLRASITGHAINQVTPLSKVGELTKYAVLAEQFPPTRAVATLLAQNIVMFVANCCLIVAAPLVVFATVDVDSRARLLLGTGAVIFALLAAIALLLLHRGPGALPFRLLRRIGVSEERAARWRKTWEETESRWREGMASGGSMGTAWISAILSRGANVAEAALILSLLGTQSPATAAVLSLAGYQLVIWLTPYVPYQAGTAEGGSYMLFSLVGFNPAHGVMLELVRKGRRLVFIVLGLTILGWHRAQQRGGSERPAG